MKKGNPLVSIVVPVYNVEQYLGQCLDSVRNQTYQNIEIILIDDGSTDVSGSICRENALADARIKVIQQKNSGVAVARNVGIREARGEYIMFVDGDDWLDVDTLESMLAEIGDADILTCAFWKNHMASEEKIYDLMEIGAYRTTEQRLEFYKTMLYSQENLFNDTLASIWNKLFRLDIIKQFYGGLEEKLRHEEDALLVYTYLLQCQSIIVSEKAHYHYRIRENSAVNSACRYFLGEVSTIYLYLDDLFRSSEYANCLVSQLQKWVKELVFYGINEKLGFDEEAKLSIYRVPYAGRLEGKNVVLYGAGKIGKEYFRSMKNEDIEITLWVDAAYEKLQKDGFAVSPIEKIANCNYDYLLIAVKEESMMKSIKENLVKLGVPETKILWSAPRLVIE